MAEKKQWHETLHDQFGQYFAVDNVLYHEKTDHQDLIIFENAAFGRVMALDGVVQTTERDEFIYHEMMTHVPLLAHGHAKHVLIIGGGDGAMLREVTRHKKLSQSRWWKSMRVSCRSAVSIYPTITPVVTTIRALNW